MKTTKEVMEQQAKIIAELRKDMTIDELYQGQLAVTKTFLERIHAAPANTVYH